MKIARIQRITTIFGVGVGTTTPDASAALDVTSTTKGFLMPRMTTTERTAIATPASGLQVYDTTTNTQWYYNGTAWVEGASTAIGSKWTNDATNSLVKLTNLSDGTTTRPTGTEFVIDDNGRVGIGTSTPNQLVHIEKNHDNYNLIKLRNNNSGTSSRNVVSIGTSDGRDLFLEHTGVNFSLGTGFELLSSDTSILGTNNSVTGGFNIVNAASTPIRFAIGGFSSSKERMRVHSNGYVGIGETAPIYPLQVKGINATGGCLALTRNFNLAILTSGSAGLYQDFTFNTDITARIQSNGSSDKSGSLSFFTNTGTSLSQKMIISKNGDVGIGLTIPVEKLDVNGAIKIGSTVSSATPIAGTIRWNATASKFQGYDGTTWVDFH